MFLADRVPPVSSLVASIRLAVRLSRCAPTFHYFAASFHADTLLALFLKQSHETVSSLGVLRMEISLFSVNSEGTSRLTSTESQL